MASTEKDENTPEVVGKNDALQHDSVEAQEVAKQSSAEPADRMDVSPAPTPTPQNELLPPSLTSTVASDAGTPGVETTDGNSAVPYGTRSRNRTGGTRINYAEDKELDHMIEASGKITKPVSTKPAHTPTPNDFEAMDHDRNVDTAARRGFTAVNTTSPAPNGTMPAMKDPIPGTSTFSANPNANGAAPQSKKRKQPGSSTTVAAPAVASTSAPKLRGGNAYQARQHVETNMMTFEGCGARLNAKRELRADDGTVLSVNGM